MSKLHGAIERAAKQVDAKKDALAKATAALAGAEGHYRDLLDRRKALAAREEEQDFYEENEYDMETDHVGQWGQSLLEGRRQSFTRPHATIVGDRHVEIGDCRGTADPACLPTVNHGGKCEVPENVASMLGKLWEDAQRAPSTPAGTVVPFTPNQDWSERKRQAISGVNTDFPTPRVPEDEDELTVQQIALQDQPPHL